MIELVYVGPPAVYQTGPVQGPVRPGDRRRVAAADVQRLSPNHWRVVEPRSPQRRKRRS
jgi:hypothetical protein